MNAILADSQASWPDVALVAICAVLYGFVLMMMLRY